MNVRSIWGSGWPMRTKVPNPKSSARWARDVVFLDELPRNPTGKILKRELAARKD
jgi:acyl-coenzyme A synthetase/AMP-(fatty) acid ligase